MNPVVNFRKRVVAAALALLALSSTGLAQESVFPSANDKRNAEQLSPQKVSQRTRDYLKRKMKNHGADARQLALDVALLEWDAARKHAQEISAQPRVDRNAGGKEGAAELTPAFFDLQDQLRTRANELDAAAGRHDPKATAAAYGALLDTCATCHAVFRAKAGASEVK